MTPATRIATRTVFITGCGRSGTTILGRLLSQRPDVQYLNDRFNLWVGWFPRADIWGKSGQHSDDAPRVDLTEDDAANLAPIAARFLRHLDGQRAGRPILVEKLAINNFRIGFLHAICPEAHFLNIIRHGVEVAFSIQERIQSGVWFGRDDRKWRLLEDYARRHGYADLLPLCAGPFEQGLLEWRMSVEAAERFLSRAPSTLRFRQVRYEDLIHRPLPLCDDLDSFLEIDPSPAMRDYAASTLRRRSPSAADRPIPHSAAPIAGAALARLGYAL